MEEFNFHPRWRSDVVVVAVFPVVGGAFEFPSVAVVVVAVLLLAAVVTVAAVLSLLVLFSPLVQLVQHGGSEGDGNQCSKHSRNRKGVTSCL